MTAAARLAIIAGLMGLFFLPDAALAQAAGRSPDDIFKQAFGRKRAAAVQELDLPVLVDGREQGAVAGRLGGEPAAAEPMVATGALADLLDPLVQAQTAAAVRRAGGADGFARLGDIAASGVGIAYDADGLLLRITLPPELRRTTELDFSPIPNLSGANTILRPAWLSAYTNIQGAMEYVTGGTGLSDTGRQALRLAFENVANLNGWVVEADTFYDEGAARRWRRGDVRLVTDFPDAAVRAAAGDIGFPVAGFQAGRALGGVAVTRNFQIQPYRVVQPAGQQDFVLPGPSVVDVIVNGRATRSFRLGAGPYSLRNFPGTTGTNDVRIRITDQFGRERTIDFPFFFDSQLLAPGVHEFAYAAGAPSSFEPGGYRYDENALTLSGLHRVGVTEGLTLGLNAQGDRQRQVYGAEALFATRLGAFSLEPAVSLGDDGGTDVAGALRFRDFGSGEEFWRQRTITAAAVYRGPDFAQPGTVTPRNPVSLDLSLRVAQPVWPSVIVSLGGRYQVSRLDGEYDSHTIDAALRTRLWRGASFDLSIQRSRRADGVSETVGFASLRFLFNDARQSGAASYDTASQEKRTQWRYQSNRPVDSLNASIDLYDRRGSRGASGDLSYVDPHFTTGLRHDGIAYRTDGSGDISRRTALSFGTALAFADGHAGVTRPIADSFAIATAHSRLGGGTVGIDPVEDTYAARSGWLGPAVLPNLSAYRVRPILIDLPDAPIEANMGDDRPTLMPAYRSGIVIPVGSDAAATLTGTLRAEDGGPAGLRSGVLRRRGGGSADIPFFSNRAGRFRIDTVSPGAWELVVFGAEDRPIPVLVPTDAEAPINLGDIRP